MNVPPLVVGTLAIDTIELPDRTVSDSFGGSASFSSIAASLFGPVRLVAGVGDDFPGEFRDLLVGCGVDMAGVVHHARKKMFRWHGRYEMDLNSRKTVGMELNLLAEYEPTVPAVFRDSPVVLIANMPPAKQLRVIEQLSGSPFIVLDTVDDWIIAHRNELIDVLGRVNAVLINDAEARLLADTNNLYHSGRVIRSFGPQLVIVKKGEHGCVLFDNDELIALPAFPTEEVVDPTGAGDSFAGGVIGYLATRKESTPKQLRRALGYGAVIAGVTVGGYGLERLRQASRSDIDERMHQYERMLRLE